MAGIGFELKKMYGGNAPAASVWGTFYPAVAVIGPVILSAAMIVCLNLLAGLSIIVNPVGQILISFASCALVAATLVAAFFAAPVSRYIADCMHLEQKSDVSAAVFGLLSISAGLSGAVMFVLCAVLYTLMGEIVIPYLTGLYLLGVLAAGTFAMMIYASALKRYRMLIYGFALGAIVAVGIFFLLNGAFGFGKLIAGCWAIATFCWLTMSVLIYQCFHDFGVPQGNLFSFLSCVRRYPRLTAAGFVSVLGLYLPSVVYWLVFGLGNQIGAFMTAAAFDATLYLAICVNMPSLIFFVISMEKPFYKKYGSYVLALDKGSYALIERKRTEMGSTLRRQLFFIYGTQLIITVLLICLVGVFLPYFQVNPQMLQVFVVLALGTYTIFCMYYTIVVLCYFADYSGSMIGVVVFAAVTAVCAWMVAANVILLGLPLLIGGICGWITACVLLTRRLGNLDSFLITASIRTNRKEQST